MTDIDNSKTEITTKKRFRSPAYPSVSLPRAIERSRQLYENAAQHSVGVKVLSDSWGLKETNGGVWSIAAALLYFGLLEDEGVADKRKFRLTDISLRIIKDSDPNSVKRKEAIQKAAINPSIHKELWDKFGVTDNISEAVIKNYLILDRKDEGKSLFSEDAAVDLIKEYNESIKFSGLMEALTKNERDGEQPSVSIGSVMTEKDFVVETVKIGDSVQVEIDGVLQLANPSRVRDIQTHENEQWVFIEGSDTGIPINQIRLGGTKDVEANAPIKSPPKLALPVEAIPNPPKLQTGEIEVLHGRLSKDTSYRLIVSGDLGPKEIGKLITLLNAQKLVLTEDDM
jgi:hypothetical protein